jgi:hypothetical protein
MQFKRFFSLDSPKAIKARAYGYLNAINYMAPAETAGVGNLCPHASKGCLALCLGWYSGQAGMVSHQNKLNHVRRSRIAKARAFMYDRKAFIAEMIAGIEQAQRAADRQGLKLCVRLNGATDIAWERQADSDGFSIFANFPDVQFVDYTKSVNRALAAARGVRTDWNCQPGIWPPNYHLTFSRSETNEADCERVLAAGGNVAVVFSEEAKAAALASGYLGSLAIDGDQHDLRHLDIQSSRLRTSRGLVIALSPKGVRARRDRSGFVVRS